MAIARAANGRRTEVLSVKGDDSDSGEKACKWCEDRGRPSLGRRIDISVLLAAAVAKIERIGACPEKTNCRSVVRAQ